MTAQHARELRLVPVVVACTVIALDVLTPCSVPNSVQHLAALGVALALATAPMPAPTARTTLTRPSRSPAMGRRTTLALRAIGVLLALAALLGLAAELLS